MMSILKRAAALGAALAMAACGGGSGAGSPPFGGGAGGGGGGVGSTPAAYAITLDIQRAGASTTQVGTSETVQAVAVVRTSAGAVVEGAVVTFGESGSALTKLAPASGTALTDASGAASVDLTGAAADSTGATTITAAVTIAGSTVNSTKAIQLTASSGGGGAGGGGGGTAAVPAAINFVGALPSGVAIVIKGAGGTGRSESAILTFKVVDANNAPIAGATLRFAINVNNGGATIQPTQAVTNGSGLATTTVSSGAQPASIVVQATTTGAAGATVITQSDTLIVSNDVPVVGGFEINALKYNLDGGLTGDSTTITAFVRDQNGNPVPDGVAVSFTTDFGVVASSTLGGCITANGQCSVDFRVQNPRGTGLATVVAQIRVGDTLTLTDSVQINMASANTSPIALDPVSGLAVSSITLSGTCKKTVELLLSDGNGRAAAAGTAIAAGFTSTGVAVTATNGSPVLDQLGVGFPPTSFALAIDLSSVDLVPPCNAAGTVSASVNYFNLEYTINNRVYRQRIGLNYPQ